jgi:hypothetical protein
LYLMRVGQRNPRAVEQSFRASKLMLA